MGDVVVEELGVLHDHERVADVRGADVVVDVDGHQSRTRQRRAKNGTTSRAHQTVIVSRCLEEKR